MPNEVSISLRISADWLESSLSAWRKFAFLAIQNAPSEDCDQTARMRRLIGIFAGRTYLEVHFRMFRIICHHSVPSSLIIKSILVSDFILLYNWIDAHKWQSQQVASVGIKHKRIWQTKKVLYRICEQFIRSVISGPAAFALYIQGRRQCLC